jgi:hypothetical protein
LKFGIHHGRQYGAVPEVVDNYSPTQGFMKEFNRYDVKSRGGTRLIGVAFRDVFLAGKASPLSSRTRCCVKRCFADPGPMALHF